MAEATKPSFPIPEPHDDLVAAFWESCNRELLSFQRCASCGAWRHLPRHLCARCGSSQWSWQPSSGRGRIHSWTITHQTPIRAFADRVPYAVVVVEMEEGVRLVSGTRGIENAELAIDLPVEVVFERVTPEVALPMFRKRADV
jgi:hypothetical protein